MEATNAVKMTLVEEHAHLLILLHQANVETLYAHQAALAVVHMVAKHITLTQTVQQDIQQIILAHLYATLANA